MCVCVCVCVCVWSEALVYRKVGRVSIPASSVLRV